MASRGMSLKTLLPSPRQRRRRLQVRRATSGSSFGLLQVVGKNVTNKQIARLALGAGFNTVYIAPVMVWKCSQP